MSEVAQQSEDAKSMQPGFDLADALLGGTWAMRKAGPTYLPKWPNEGQLAYEMRLSVSTLFPAYKRTVETLAGKPFSKPVTVNEDVPPAIRSLLDSVDSEGRNLDTFAAQVLEVALGYGHGGILVDFPQLKEAKTQADQKLRGDRPYFVLVRPQAILGWKAVRVGAAWSLSQLRIMEIVKRPVGPYLEEELVQVRVLEVGKWELHQPDSKGIYHMVDSGVSSLKYIPFVPIYGKQLGFMMSTPPLLEVAHLNVQHWQSSSDQQNILHVARVPILAVIGGGDEVSITVGAASAVKLPPGADMKWVEHTGAAIGAGRDDLADLEERMRQAGAELLVIAPGKITATQINTENAVGMCALQRITLNLQDGLNTALQYTADLIKAPSGGTVTLFLDFAASTLSEASAKLLLDANLASKISDKTLLEEWKRRDILSPNVDSETEKGLLEDQGPPLGSLIEPQQPPTDSPVGL